MGGRDIYGVKILLFYVMFQSMGNLRNKKIAKIKMEIV